jgi:hypothetical protein
MMREGGSLAHSLFLLGQVYHGQNKVQGLLLWFTSSRNARKIMTSVMSEGEKLCYDKQNGPFRLLSGLHVLSSALVILRHIAA